MKIQIGQLAPKFELPDQDGKVRSLSDWQGKWILLYFYPKDETSGCIKEACSIRDNFPKFGKLNIEVVGVSADSVKSHKEFAENHGLPFTLLSDENKEVIKKYDVSSLLGIARTSFLIDPEGKIVKIYENVKPEIHAEEVLNDIISING